MRARTSDIVGIVAGGCVPIVLGVRLELYGTRSIGSVAFALVLQLAAIALVFALLGEKTEEAEPSQARSAGEQKLDPADVAGVVLGLIVAGTAAVLAARYGSSTPATLIFAAALASAVVGVVRAIDSARTS